MKTFCNLVFVLIASHVWSQDGWEWELIGNMPEPVSNNAVTEGYSGDTLCVYSFTGIGSGLTPNDIHLKSWRYNTILDEWQSLPDVDDFRGKIAAGASTVKNKIYVIGGYHVFDNLSETTSPKVHRFDPEINSWLSDGADIPVPVDDQVQAVWRDSLIYIVTGWSTNTNVAAVQIYNPSSDEWSAATSVPTNNDFRAFGASGTIIGDTIFYFGGTQISGFNFVANKKFRKGIINPDNPTEITWEFLGNAPTVDNGYRMAATDFQNEAIWIGGAGIAYNFDGIAYSNNQGVEPLGKIRTYNSSSTNWVTAETSPHQIMDLRGIARESSNSWLIAGGITNSQEVSNELWRVTRATVNTVDRVDSGLILTQNGESLNLTLNNEKFSRIDLYSISGVQILMQKTSNRSVQINTSAYSPGIYLVIYTTQSGFTGTEKIAIF